MTDSDVAAEWDARYATKGQVWSGNVNRLLPREVEGLEPGTALDVGSGEGADSIWLAKNGWDVTGVDISAVAVERAAALAAREGVAIDFLAADISTTTGRFDLVSAFFPSVPSDSDMLEHILGLVAPKGTLLFVHHVHPDPESASDYRPHRPGFMSPFDVLAELEALGDEWRVDKIEVVENGDDHGGHREHGGHHHHGGHHQSGSDHRREPEHRHEHGHHHEFEHRHETEHHHESGKHRGLGRHHQFDAVLKATRI